MHSPHDEGHAWLRDSPILSYQMVGDCVLPAPMPPPFLFLFPNEFGQDPQTTPKALEQADVFLGLGHSGL